MDEDIVIIIFSDDYIIHIYNEEIININID